MNRLAGGRQGPAQPLQRVPRGEAPPEPGQGGGETQTQFGLAGPLG